MQQILGPPSDEEIQYLENNLIEKNVMELFKRCTQLEKNEKLNIFDLLRSTSAYSDGFYKDEDLKDAADLIEACLTWLPKDRISAKDAMSHKFCKF